MKILRTFRSKMEAEMACQFLKAQDISAEVRGAKEYISHLMGGDQGRYELLVDPELADLAEKKLQEISAKPAEVFLLGANTYLRRSIACAFIAAAFFPLLFNIVSLYNLRLFAKVETDVRHKRFFVIVVIGLQLPSVIIPWLMFR